MKDQNKFQLILLPGKCLPGGAHSELYERVYAIWKETWIHVFTEVGSPQAWSADAFFRCDQIPVILFEGKIAAFYLATIYPLQPALLCDHSYFSIFSEAAKQRLLKHGVRSVMSYEFLSVLPRWRKSELGFSLGAVLVELGLSLRDELDCDAAVGVARIQNKIDQIAHAVGAFTLEKEARRGNLVCEIVGFLKANDRSYPEHRTHDLAVQLWSERVTINKFGNAVTNEIKPIAA